MSKVIKLRADLKPTKSWFETVYAIHNGMLEIFLTEEPIQLAVAEIQDVVTIYSLYKEKLLNTGGE